MFSLCRHAGQGRLENTGWSTERGFLCQNAPNNARHEKFSPYSCLSEAPHAGAHPTTTMLLFVQPTGTRLSHWNHGMLGHGGRRREGCSHRRTSEPQLPSQQDASVASADVCVCVSTAVLRAGEGLAQREPGGPLDLCSMHSSHSGNYSLHTSDGGSQTRASSRRV